jgi:hypothetical protein
LDVVGHGFLERVPVQVVGVVTTNSPIAQKWHSMRFAKPIDWRYARRDLNNYLARLSASDTPRSLNAFALRPLAPDHVEPLA